MPVEIIRDTEAGNPKPVGKGAIIVEYNQLRLKFSSPRGYGDEVYAAIVQPDQFSYLARAMMMANSTEAIKAFGDALKRGVREKMDPMKRWMPQWEDDQR